MDRAKPIPTAAIAINNGFAIAILVANHIWPAGPFYFWLGIAILSLGTAALTGWGERLR